MNLREELLSPTPSAKDQTQQVRISHELRRVARAFHRCPSSMQEELLAKARTADVRDPKMDPAFMDRLMASAGGAAATFRQVESVIEGVVYFYSSNSPFGKDKLGQCTIEKWRKWASRASTEHRSSIEIYVPGAGWTLYDDVLAAANLPRHLYDLASEHQ